jgi:hypothetical protein
MRRGRILPGMWRVLAAAMLIALASEVFPELAASADLTRPAQHGVASADLTRAAQQGVIQGAADPVSARRELLTRYCVTCHSQRLKTAGLSLETLDPASIGDQADVWEKVVRKLRVGMMPPIGAPRPDRATALAFTSELERELDRAAAARPNAGRTETLHRLNRFEYQNVIRDVLGLEVDARSLLPADDVSYGFDNVAAIQRMSPMLLDRYVAAARRISQLALGTNAVVTSETIRLKDDYPQDDEVDGLPFGTRGGASVRYTFPVDGEYAIRVRIARVGVNGESIPRYPDLQRLEISLDGAPLREFTTKAAPRRAMQEPNAEPRVERAADADWQVRFPAKAGSREIAVTWLNRVPALLESRVQPFSRPYAGGARSLYTTRKGLYVDSIDIDGPFVSIPGSDSPSRRHIFICRPTRTSDAAACAKTIVSALAKRAYRRPATEEELAQLLEEYDKGRAEGFDAGIQRAIQALLVMPAFLFRIEREPRHVAPDTNYRISDLELASRLSFFLWSSVPDSELLDAAVRGTLKTPAVLSKQVRRMLADRRSQAFVTNFVGQWLLLRNLPEIGPDPNKAPNFDDGLREGFRRETELFFESILREERSALDLLKADYTFVNERLAKHYGIPHVRGSHFRRVPLTDERRRGLLGQGSVLVLTSRADRTSPVQRGKWILENLLGSPPPDPPPNVPPLPDSTGPEPRSMRERMARHRANPVCAGCHSLMDPLGFALENFDLAGAWRDVDESSLPVDTTGTLPDGSTFSGVVDLRRRFVASPDVFVQTLTEKLLTYALGRGVEYYDLPAIRKIVHDSAQGNYALSSLMIGIVNSVPFQMRRSASAVRPERSVASGSPARP